MRDRVTISLNPLSTTRLTRLSKRKLCSSCAYLLVPHRALSGKKSRIVFANVNILFTSGRVGNRFTTGSRDSKGCERAPEFGVLFTFCTYCCTYIRVHFSPNAAITSTKTVSTAQNRRFVHVLAPNCRSNFGVRFLPKSLTNQPLCFTLLSVCSCPSGVGNNDRCSLRSHGWGLCCSCPIYRAWRGVWGGDKPPNYKALRVQLRKS